jgi:hypothetical protein
LAARSDSALAVDAQSVSANAGLAKTRARQSLKMKK